MPRSRVASEPVQLGLSNVGREPETSRASSLRAVRSRDFTMSSNRLTSRKRTAA